MIEEMLIETLRLELQQLGWNNDDINIHLSKHPLNYALNQLWFYYDLAVDEIGEKQND